jgi:hypothetical protein
MTDVIREAAEEIAKKYNLVREGWVTIGRVTIDRETETLNVSREARFRVDA